MVKRRSLGFPWLEAYLDEGSPTFMNATASARKAGYKARTPGSFRSIGYQNRLKYTPKIEHWLEEHGFSETRLRIRLLRLLEAKQTVHLKLRGAVLQSSLPEGCRVIAISGTVVSTKDGKVYGDGDTLLAIDVVALETQRKTLDMALKMRGLYAAEKHEHSGVVTTVLQLTDKDRKLLRQSIDGAIKKLMEATHAKPA